MYKPKQGDICYVDFAPTKGHEQSGLRPAIVISRNNYNKYLGLVFLCPITTNTKKFPTHYELINTKKIIMHSFDFEHFLFFVEAVKALKKRLCRVQMFL